jgi:hypothetical protein
VWMLKRGSSVDHRSLCDDDISAVSVADGGNAERRSSDFDVTAAQLKSTPFVTFRSS